MPARSSENHIDSASILLVDDNRYGLTARKSVLQELGYRITICTDPLQAVEIFRANAFDLVVTDYKMPRLNGGQLIAAMRELRAETPFILLTGFAESLGFTEEGTGADLVIQKSSNEVVQLVRAVARLLKKTPSRKTQAKAKPPLRGVARAKGVS
ncbi:MAG: response regulator [Candidatus Solibacter usitatus]|nr:response regulator [Candidatus Solibacter usitatus]